MCVEKTPPLFLGVEEEDAAATLLLSTHFVFPLFLLFSV